MPAYQIHRLKDSQRQQFRWAPHTSGLTIAKPKDYEPGLIAEGVSPYAVWLALRETEQALQVGDLVETEAGGLPHSEVHWIRRSSLVRTRTFTAGRAPTRTAGRGNIGS